MGTVLFTHELGAGFGHLNRLLHIAKNFRSHRIVVGVPDPSFAKGVIEKALGSGPRLLTVGLWRRSWPTRLPMPSGPTWTLADMLYEFGFAEPDRVRSGVSAWKSDLDDVRPDLIVADFAPMLRIAAADRIPTVTIGNGFTVPPRLAPLPAVSSGDQSPSAASRAREEAVLSSVNAVRADLGRPDFDCLADLFGGDDTFVSSFGLFDPYDGLRSRPLLAPFNIPRVAKGPPHDERTGPRAFCYLDPTYAGLDTILTALNNLAQPSQIFIRGLDPRVVVPHCAPQVGIHQSQADFRSILPQTRLLIHHGTLGTAAAGLLAGLPQLLLPFNLEQELTAFKLAELGCAVALQLGASSDPVALLAIIEDLLASAPARSAAISGGHRLAASWIADPELPIVDACRARLPGC